MRKHAKQRKQHKIDNFSRPSRSEDMPLLALVLFCVVFAGFAILFVFAEYPYRLNGKVGNRVHITGCPNQLRTIWTSPLCYSVHRVFIKILSSYLSNIPKKIPTHSMSLTSFCQIPWFFQVWKENVFALSQFSMMLETLWYPKTKFLLVFYDWFLNPMILASSTKFRDFC